MTTCPACAAWCATSEKQLANRLANVAGMPDVQTYACPQCGGTEWATSDAMVVKDEPSTLRRFLERVRLW